MEVEKSKCMISEAGKTEFCKAFVQSEKNDA